MKDRFEGRRNNRSLSPARGPAQLILFPLCDPRGLITESLSDARPRLEGQEAENIFFAWLLDLPAEIDAAAAARAMLLVSGVTINDSGEGSSVGRTFKGKFRRTMVALLQRVVSRGSLYEPAQLLPANKMPPTPIM